MTTTGTSQPQGRRRPRTPLTARPAGPDLLGPRVSQRYTAAEQQFSKLVHRQIEALLQGRTNTILLLRLYPGMPDRLGIMVTPTSIDVDALRLTVVRQLLEEAVLFLAADALG